jgi:integrase/recombinase XerD
MRLSKRNSTVPAMEVKTDRMHALMNEYLSWIGAQNYSEDTLRAFRFTIGYFLDWCGERGLDTPHEITRPVLERYQRWLYHYRKKNGEPMTFRSQGNRLRSLRSWFRWMARQNYILHNPASELILPRLENRLPKHILNVEEAETILQQATPATTEGLRDRAILETLFATGMRRMEIVNLKVYDIDRERGTVMIRQGKGKKDRHIPIGERALSWIAKYIAEARPELLGGSDDGSVFLDAMGAAFERPQLTNLVRGYVRRSGVGKVGGCHLFRHTMATLMLENGADIRVIQEMLGHSKLTTTELYTRVSINLLKQVYAATHPGAGLKRPNAKTDSPEAAELLDALAAEAAEEDA